MSNVILAGIIGFLAGLLLCYWKQIQAAYQNRGVISDVTTIAGAGAAVQDLYNKI